MQHFVESTGDVTKTVEGFVAIALRDGIVVSLIVAALVGIFAGVRRCQGTGD